MNTETQTPPAVVLSSVQSDPTPKPRAELLELAKQCGAVLTGKPDGSEDITVVFTVRAWRAFDAALGNYAIGDEAAEHKTISVRRFRDPSGAPTCCADHSAGETCRFLGVRNFGRVDVCMLGVQRDLAPRTTGFQRPDTRCEVWTTSNADDKT